MTEQAVAQPSAPVDYWDFADTKSKAQGSMKAANIIRIVQTVLFTAVAGFAVSVVVAGPW